MTDIPHFAVPFDVESVGGKTRIAETEQGSIDEVVDCVYTVLQYPLGFRPEKPDFGVDDPTFQEGAQGARLRSAVAKWEPRAEQEVEEQDPMEDGLRRIRMYTSVGDE